MPDTIDEYATLDQKCLPQPNAVGALMAAIHTASCVGASTTWRIQIDAVQGGGNQVQLTEAAFLLGEDQLGGGIVAPVISPSGTNSQDPLFMNNVNPESADQSNCDPLPCTFTYTFDNVVTPDAVRLAYADSPPRWPTGFSVDYLDANSNQWTHFSTNAWPAPPAGCPDRPSSAHNACRGPNDPVRRHDTAHSCSLHSRLQESCLLYTSPSPRDATLSRMPSSA